MSKLGKILFLLSGLSLVSFAIVRFLIGAWVPFLWVALGLFAGFLITASWIDRSFYKEFLSMKTTKKGMSMGAMIALMLILLVGINFIAVRKYKTFDFSQAQINTLSEQSIKLAKGLTEDLSVIYFYKNGTEGVEQNRRAFIDLIKKYQDQTDKIKLQFVEINERPDLVEKYDVKQGTQVVILDYQGRRGRIEKVEEQELTSAIVKVTRTTNKKIYILSGHAELPMTANRDGGSISQLKELLTNNRYEVKDFSMTTSTQIPKDADVVIVVGPKAEYLDVEIRGIEDYLRSGGGLILALRSGLKSGFEPILKKVGISLKNNYIATVLQTPMGTAVDPRFARGSVFSSENQITKPFSGNQFTVFRIPSAIDKVASTPAGITIDEIVKTNESVMGFTDTKFDKAGDKGPFTLAVAVKGQYPTDDLAKDSKSSTEQKEFNLLIFGDADFMNDQYLYQSLNRDLVLNSVASLAKEEDLISVTPKEISKTEMNLTQTQWVLFIFGFIIPLPLLLFVSSGVLWYRRRYS